MREAALKAGMITSLESDNLLLALEPEAACMACENESKRMKVGESFMVLDCGGGTVDITTYKVVSTDPWRVEEAAIPSGGPWGSTFVDAQFEKFVSDLFGAETFDRFKPSAAWIDLMQNWEGVKLSCNSVESFDDGSTKAVNFAPMLDYLQEGETIASLVSAYNRKYGTNLQTKRSTTVLVPLDKIQRFFLTVIEKIQRHVTDLLQKTPVDYILLVGGFAESKILMHRIKNAVEDGRTKVVVPQRPGLAVVKGAVAFSLNQGRQIQSRLARYTYGTQVAHLWDPSKFPEQRGRKTQTHMKQGVPRLYVCDHFWILVRKGDRVEPGHTATKAMVTSDDGHTSVTVKLFVSSTADPKFVDEEGVHKIGSVELPMTVNEEGKMDVGFGSTEIEATLTNETTGKRTRTAVNYSFSQL